MPEKQNRLTTATFTLAFAIFSMAGTLAWGILKAGFVAGQFSGEHQQLFRGHAEEMQLIREQTQIIREMKCK